MSAGPTGSIPPIDPDERLARRIFDSDKARDPINPRVFRVSSYDAPISVDRRDRMADAELLRLADEDGHARGGRLCRGWAVLNADSAARQGRSVHPSPMLGNVHHAEIHLNISAADEEEIKEEWKHHRLELAAASVFLSRAQVAG